MRIVAGIAKGRRLQVPAGREVRPTTDRVREAIFSALGACVEGARVLDLFAGSGALGLEALSRGARSATFVEPSAKVRPILQDNIVSLGFAAAAVIISAQASVALRRFEHSGEPFDLVFLDPPYASNLLDKSLEFLATSSCTRHETILIAEHPAKNPLSPKSHLQVEDTKRYGDTMITRLSKIFIETVSPSREQPNQ